MKYVRATRAEEETDFKWCTEIDTTPAAERKLRSRSKTATMTQHRLSARKRLAKPILFGTLLVGLATIFINRHRFFEDVVELRAQEEARNYARMVEVLERRQKQKELAEKKKQQQTGSD